MADDPDENKPRPGRGRGRPGGAELAVGRDGLIRAAIRLLKTHPPSQVTGALIAREAGGDPALIRYHFGDRETLLLAAVEEIMSAQRRVQPPKEAPPAAQLAGRIRDTIDLAQEAQSMQRLLIDELASANSPAIRARISAINATAVALYARVLDQERPEPLRPVDPLFLFVAVIGMCDFFASGRPLIDPQVPAGTDFEDLAERYAAFCADVMLNGLRPR